jgi:hypothetical protein
MLTGAERACGRFVTPPAAPYTATLRMTAFSGLLNSELNFGIALRNSTTGRVLVNYLTIANNAFNLQQWSTINAFNANIAAGPNQIINHQQMYVAFHVSGAGAVTAYYSADGVHWEAYGSTTLATYINAAGGTTDQVGVWMAGATGGRRMYGLATFWRVDAINPPAVALN